MAKKPTKTAAKKPAKQQPADTHPQVYGTGTKSIPDPQPRDDAGRFAPNPAYDIQACTWSKIFEDHINQVAAYVDPLDWGSDVDWYKAEAKRGGLALLAGIHDGRHVASAAYRIEAKADGSQEMVLVAVGGDRGADTIRELLPPLIELCQAAEIASIRFHTRRPELVRVMERAAGARQVETALRINVA